LCWYGPNVRSRETRRRDPSSAGDDRQARWGTSRWRGTVDVIATYAIAANDTAANDGDGAAIGGTTADDGDGAAIGGTTADDGDTSENDDNAAENGNTAADDASS
jgi:hypothetical protein